MAKRVKDHGMTLIEVLIALAIFAAVSVALVATVTDLIDSSNNFRNDVKLHSLAELKMNEVLIGNREFSEATNNSEDSGQFEVEGFEDYKYKVQIRRMELPNLAEIMGQTGEQEDRTPSRQLDIQNRIFGILKKNLEEMIWQVRVEVTAPNNQIYELTSWIEKSNAQIDKNFGF